MFAYNYLVEMSQGLVIECKVVPFTIPSFTAEGASDLHVFPTKLDCLVADIDGNNVIDDADVALWSDPDAVCRRWSELENRIEGDTAPLESQAWWKGSDVIVYCRIDNLDTDLTWNEKEKYALRLIVPPELMDLQATVMYLYHKQIQFARDLLAYIPHINGVYDELYSNPKIFTLSDTYKDLKQRIDHLESTYVRL